MACTTSWRNSDIRGSRAWPQASRARLAKSSRCPTRKKELDTRQVIAHGSKSVSPNHSSDLAGLSTLFAVDVTIDLQGMMGCIHSWNRRSEKGAEISCNLTRLSTCQNKMDTENWIRIYGFKHGGLWRDFSALIKNKSMQQRIPLTQCQNCWNSSPFHIYNPNLANVSGCWLWLGHHQAQGSRRWNLQVIHGFRSQELPQTRSEDSTSIKSTAERGTPCTWIVPGKSTGHDRRSQAGNSRNPRVLIFLAVGEYGTIYIITKHILIYIIII